MHVTLFVVFILHYQCNEQSLILYGYWNLVPYNKAYKQTFSKLVFNRIYKWWNDL